MTAGMLLPQTCVVCGFLRSCGSAAGPLPGNLKTRYAHLARFARYAYNIPGTQDEAARLMDDILTPIPIDLRLVST